MPPLRANPAPPPAEAQIRLLRAAVLATFFAGYDEAFLTSPAGQAVVDAQVMGRDDECTRTIVPWIERHRPLAGAQVIEIGCGAGASTAALARRCGRIAGYDIDAAGITAAKARMEVLGLRNTDLFCVEPTRLLPELEARHGGHGTDIVFCYAVLEHQTFEERLETLRTCWRVLRDGGLLVIADTPNRLTYMDHHTAFLPFFHMLPHEVAVAYAAKSPRPSFPESIAAHRAVSEAEAEERLIRWGRGVSYHEFELALGPLEDLVVGDGFDPEILGEKPIAIEDRLLYTYWRAAGLSVPTGFVRQSIDIILRKPGGPPAPRRVREWPMVPLREPRA